MVEKTLEQRITALEDELAKAKEEAAAKEKAAAEAGKEFKLKEPWKRFDPTSRMGMPASAMVLPPFDRTPGYVA
jgi:septal ring factor EnvC (AmiA/AmiB activator)